MAKLGIKDGETTNEDPSFTTYEKATKGLLVEKIGGEVEGEVLSIWDALVGMAPFWRVENSIEIGVDSPMTTRLASVDIRFCTYNLIKKDG